jgi:hypothetical protein
MAVNKLSRRRSKMLRRRLSFFKRNRHIADYNNHEQWTTADVEATLNKARSAFQDWQSVSTHPMAGNYLLAMLLPKPRP